MTTAYDALGAFEQWCVRSNLRRVRDGEMTLEVAVATVRANGYRRAADAILAEGTEEGL